MRRFVSALAFAAMLAAPAGAFADTVKVGLIAPFSGGFAIWGQQFQQAVQAFQKVNGTSVKGDEVEVIYRDSGGPDPAKSKQLAEELILRDKIKFLSGFAFTPNAMAVADLITEANMPTVIMNAATAVITRKSPMFVRDSMTLPQQTGPLGKWVAAKGYKKVYTLVSDYGPGHDAEQQFIKTYTANGGTILASVRAPLSTTDYAPFVENMLQAKPDAIYIFMPAGPPSIAVIQEWDKRGLKAAGIPLFGTGETQEVFLPAIGQAGLGAITAMHYNIEQDNEQNKLLKSTLIEMFGPDTLPDIASVAAWDGMRLIYDALAELGPDADGKAYIEFMKGRKIDSPRGPIMIDPETRDIVQNIYIRELVMKDGKMINQPIDTIEMVKDPWKEENPE
jgi:branched-chain amino acid transport system substrate-binding protein